MFFPFGFNPRKCVGQKFALLEVKQLIAIIVSEYHIALEQELHHPFPVESTFTMKIALENIPLYFEERKEQERKVLENSIIPLGL
jgi:cytochrome P450